MKIEEIFIVDLTLTTKCQIDGEDFVNFCGLLVKHELYLCGQNEILSDNYWRLRSTALHNLEYTNLAFQFYCGIASAPI